MKDSIDTADYIFVHESRGEIRGFAAVYHEMDDGKHLHISLICNSVAPGVHTRKNVPKLGGKALINAVIDYGRKIKVKDVRLDAIKEVIPYYYNLGFTFENSQYNKGEEERLINDLRLSQLNKNKTEIKKTLQTIVLKFYTGFFKEKMQHNMGKDDEERITYAMDFGIPMKYVYKNNSICKGKSVSKPNKCRKHKTCKVANGKKRSFCRTIKNKTRISPPMR